MPHLDSTTDRLLREAPEDVKRRASRFWHGFADFALRDNVLEIGVGLILAAAFTTVVTSFVSEILLPILSLLPFINRNFDEWFAVLRAGPKYGGQRGGYRTVREALDDGAVVMGYGIFLNKLFNFLGVGMALYVIANLYTWLSDDAIIKNTVKCTFCRKRVSEKAQRCVNCTSWLDGREQ